jgi:addiction module HigA family antidote
LPKQSLTGFTSTASQVRTRSALSHLVNESADLSWDMAIRLAKAFGSTPEGWMRLQFQFDAAQVEERAKKIKVKTFADVVNV